jgi:hypothetical protein
MIRSDPANSHYMGAIVLQGSDDSNQALTVIDGQQRLATLSIIAIAVIDKIQKLAEGGEQKDANQERQKILRRTYLSDRDPRSLRYSSKLILNENSNDFYQGNLINLRKPFNIRSLAKSNQLLWSAFQYFSECLDELQDVVYDGEKLTEFLTEVVARRLLFIQIRVQDELNAYTVFETLNARGIELSATDLLKNYLFSRFQGPDDLQEAQRQWRRIISTVRMEKFPEFLRYYLSLSQTRVRRERLFKIVKNVVKSGSQSFELLDQLENYSSLFIALSHANDDFWRDSPENIPYIRELELFRIKQAYPALFAAYTKFSPNDFTRLLKLICGLSFRYTVVSRLNPNDLEVLYNKTAITINQGEITTPRQVFEYLRPIYVPDQKFVQDFAFLRISTRGQQKKLAKYILYKLEMDASRREDLAEDGFSIEHILPESPKQDWYNHFKDDQIEDMVYRLGNLTPLEPSLNREVGHESYAIKREAYQQRSRYGLTQMIAAEDWTVDTIAARQRQLAQRAVHVWRSDFWDAGDV